LKPEGHLSAPTMSLSRLKQTKQKNYDIVMLYSEAPGFDT